MAHVDDVECWGMVNEGICWYRQIDLIGLHGDCHSSLYIRHSRGMEESWKIRYGVGDGDFS